MFCNDVTILVGLICQERGLNEDDIVLKIGVDGGKEFLKLTLTIISGLKETQGLSFKETSAKKMFILCISPGTTENYDI